MSDDHVRTKVETDEGTLDFQDYFVRRRCEPAGHLLSIRGSRCGKGDTGCDGRRFRRRNLVVICPSNPFVSVAPILALEGLRPLIAAKPCVAISPIVGGEAIKGPAAKMMFELGVDVSAAGVARQYQGLAGGFVLDDLDSALEGLVQGDGMRTLVTNTVMRLDSDRRRLADDVLRFASDLEPVLSSAT